MSVRFVSRLANGTRFANQYAQTLIKTVTAMFLESKIIRAAFLLTLPITAWGQVGTQIFLVNPSFEDTPERSHTPNGWYDCGQMKDSPPDTQPGGWDVSTLPKHGNTYLGMVVRDNKTWESVGQRLSRPMEVNQCYEFSLSLCRSDTYKSGSASQPTTSRELVNYSNYVRILIWGGNGYCGKGELLDQTAVIKHTRWINYDFSLSPTKGSWSHIIIEAYFGANDPFNPMEPLCLNGNILVDNASPIKQVTCGPDKMPDIIKKPPFTKKGPDKPPVVVATKPAPPTPTPEAPKPKRGRSFRLDVYFKANEYTFDLGSSEKSLEELYAMLKNNTDISVEIGGHTNNLLYPNEGRALELSNSRAKSVADWLISKGVSPDRVQYKGYGWTKPVEPNTTPEGRKRNQRVEVTILTFDR